MFWNILQVVYWILCWLQLLCSETFMFLTSWETLTITKEPNCWVVNKGTDLSIDPHCKTSSDQRVSVHTEHHKKCLQQPPCIIPFANMPGFLWTLSPEAPVAFRRDLAVLLTAVPQENATGDPTAIHRAVQQNSIVFLFSSQDKTVGEIFPSKTFRHYHGTLVVSFHTENIILRIPLFLMSPKITGILVVSHKDISVLQWDWMLPWEITRFIIWKLNSVWLPRDCSDVFRCVFELENGKYATDVSNRVQTKTESIVRALINFQNSFCQNHCFSTHVVGFSRKVTAGSSDVWINLKESFVFISF